MTANSRWGISCGLAAGGRRNRLGGGLFTPLEGDRNIVITDAVTVLIICVRSLRWRHDEAPDAPNSTNGRHSQAA